MEIELKEVERLAKLSKLLFDGKELVEFKSEFEHITEFVNKVATANIEEVTTVGNMLTVDQLRTDDIKESMPQEAILYNAPENENGAFVVPKVIE